MAGPVLAILGPTGIGKTAVAVEVCRAHQGEIISIDSRQVFRGIEVASNAPTADELGGVRCHLVGVLDPGARIDAARYTALARPLLAQLRIDGTLAALTAGTGMYLKALLDDLPLGGVTPEPAARARLETRAAANLPSLVDELRGLDPAAAARIDSRNPARVVRAVELARARAAAAVPKATPRPIAAIKVGLTAPREALYAAIDARVDRMLERGWREEVERLLAEGVDPRRQAFSGIGVAEMAEVIDGRTSLEAARAAIAQRTRNYAKRQLTWFRAEGGVTWFDVTVLTVSDIVERISKMLAVR
jgi:tRNA dimethylallyltransferase